MSNFIIIGDHKFSINIEEHLFGELFDINYKIFNESNNHTENMRIDIMQGYGLPFQDYIVTIQENAHKITYQRADYLIEVNPSYTKAKIFFHDELALKHAMMNLYSAFIVHNNWGLLVHSSCVVDNGGAHIFSGHSGAGKSTAAKLSAPRQLLSDEATILKVTDNGITVFDSPFRSELETKGEVTTAPLASINLLHQALSNNREVLKKGEAFTSLIDKVFYWPYNSGETAKIMMLLRKLVEQVPVYNLHFQKNNSFWELITNDKLQMQAKL
ncbi:hypothetical protein [Sediminibacillus massiliensis]|uniref:hypothetical protein n=1 Tax=Sediminibacillus massiliensis TaxID=1926277 RepID=UPI0009885A68|nr:hypothetical protein [Sediminibacillus massiliensis]